MKIVNQWIVFHKNSDKLLVETKSGKFFLQDLNSSFEEIEDSEAYSLINPK